MITVDQLGLWFVFCFLPFLGLHFSVSLRSPQANMSHRGPLTAVITTVLGATLGGLLIWRVYRTKRRKLPSVQKVADPVEAPCPVEKEFPAVEFQLTETPFQAKELKAVECQTTQLPPLQIPSSEQLLGAKPVMVSSEEEWLQLWPLMQKELSVLPVLGLDCEWVKVTAVRNAFLMILYTKRKNNIYPNISKLLLFFSDLAAGFCERQSLCGLSFTDGHIYRSVCPGEAAGVSQRPADIPSQLNGGPPRPSHLESWRRLL